MYIGSDKTTLSVGNISSTNYTDVGLIVGFNEIKLSELLSITNTAMKRTRALDSFYSFSIAYKGDFTINKPSTGHAALLDNTGYNSTITSMIPCIAKNNQAVSYSRYLADTAAVLQVTTKLYEDSTMVFQMDDADVCMDITRKALNTLKDYATIKHREINYGNPDNVTKTINTSFNQLNMGGAHSCTINISHLSIPANDSLVTKNPGNFQYQLIHPQSGNLTYDLSIYAVYNDTVKHFSYSGIPLSGTTSHTIDPYFNGTQPAVIIDNGLNNINDDTLFVNQSPLEEDDAFENSNGITVYPNPVNNELSVAIEGPINKHYQILITNMNGKIEREVSCNTSSLQHIEHIATKDLSSELYVVYVMDDHRNMIFKQKISKE